MTILRTQAETDAYLETHVEVGKCIEVTFAPTEAINLDRWIKPHECCSDCGEATPGLRMTANGPDETCRACKEGGCLVTMWGEAQAERWHVDREGGEQQAESDNGPQVGPILVYGGDPKHVRSLRRQADRALIKFKASRRAPPAA